MKRRCDKADGLTLAELLVVLAIVAILAGVTVPAFVKMGFFSDTGPADGARELNSMLRAARVFAISNHVDTALVYTIQLKAETLVVDGIFMARKASRREISEHGLREKAFVAVQNSYGVPRLFKSGTCLRDDVLTSGSIDPNYPPQDLQYADGIFTADKRGEILVGMSGIKDAEAISLKSLKAITVYSDDFSRIIDPRNPPQLPGWLGGLAYKGEQRFPAHVFQPTGTLEVDGDLQKRITLYVSHQPVPGSPENVRQPVRVDVYPTTGRVKVAS